MASAEVETSERQHEAGGSAVEMPTLTSSAGDNHVDAQPEVSPIDNDDHAVDLSTQDPIDNPTKKAESKTSEMCEAVPLTTNHSEEQQPHVEPTESSAAEDNAEAAISTPAVIIDEQPKEPTRDEVNPTEAESSESNGPQTNQSDESQSSTEPIALSPSCLPINSSAPKVDNESEVVIKTPVPNECPATENTNIPETAENENQPTEGALSQNKAISPEIINVSGVESTVQTPDSLTTKPSGFLDSLTAEFASDTKAAWAQIFGPRYEDEDEGSVRPDEGLLPAIRTSASISSLQTKLERERRLDEQIQASQRRYRERVLRNEVANITAKSRERRKPSYRSRPSTAKIPTVSPFEQAGLSLTQVRFCTEKALDETCKCFRNLHAEALDEAGNHINSTEQGIFVTQWELEHLFRELFDPQEPAPSLVTNRKTSVVAPLDFTTRDNTMPLNGISMGTLLQASWFLPFGQLPQLRSLVMKITRRHLNEDKLAIVNRHLQKQFTLLPLSHKLQKLVLEFCDYLLSKPADIPAAKLQLQSSISLAHDMLECIVVNKVVKLKEMSEENGTFLLLSPSEILSRAQISSVVCAQRLIFFHFLIEIIAVEKQRARLTRPATVFASTLPDRTVDSSVIPAPTKRKTIARKRSRNASSVVVDEGQATNVTTEAQNADTGSVLASTLAAHGSLPSAFEVGVDDTSALNDRVQHPTVEKHTYDEREPVNQLQQQLEAAISRLRQAIPTIDSGQEHDPVIYSVNPTFKATYLAAVACHQSIQVMTTNNIKIDDTMSENLQHFIQALAAIQPDRESPTALVSSQSVGEDSVTHGAPRFPPPYPESTVQEQSEERSENSTHFPPPYAITTPSYWTFSPSIPEPKASIAKLANESISNNFADLRFRFMPQPSPGVGTYNIQQGDKLTFQERPSYSFGSPRNGHAHVERSVVLDASQPQGSRGKPSSNKTLHHKTKTSLAFVPPLFRSAQDNQYPADTRAHALSQCDVFTSNNCYLFDSSVPEYVGGDASEAPAENAIEKDKDERVETEMGLALRLQQRMFMDEFVQQVVSKQAKPPHSIKANTSAPDKRRRSSPTSKPHWATSEISPGIERLMQRQRRAPKSRVPPARSVPGVSQPKPRASRPAKRVSNIAPDSPPRRQLDNDQHLAWAARISELYQPGQQPLSPTPPYE